MSQIKNVTKKVERKTESVQSNNMIINTKRV